MRRVKGEKRQVEEGVWKVRKDTEVDRMIQMRIVNLMRDHPFIDIRYLISSNPTIMSYLISGVLGG